MHTPHDIVITACGMLSALGIGCEESAAAWQEGESACFPPARIAAPAGCDALAGEVPPVALADLALAPKAYLDRQSELLLAAAALARSAGKLAPDSFAAERVGLAMGTAWGAVQTLDLFFDDYVKKGPRLVKPILFPHSYANAGISLVAMEWEARGPHLNFVSGNDASTQALIAALDLLRSGEADLIMAGGAEGLNATRWPPSAGRRCRRLSDRTGSNRTRTRRDAPGTPARGRLRRRGAGIPARHLYRDDETGPGRCRRFGKRDPHGLRHGGGGPWHHEPAPVDRPHPRGALRRRGGGERRPSNSLRAARPRIPPRAHPDLHPLRLCQRAGNRQALSSVIR
jgi:hypothetical protein